MLDRLQQALASRYTIERELGHGGMAVVYLAQDLKHRRPVAIKVLRPELAYAIGPERFLREIEIAARLAHPHILPLHDSGNADGVLYYVMPYVEGESLRDRLQREGKLPVEEAVRITSEVADALGYAHQAGLVHRDIKPENILLQAGHAVVSDFGIARAVSAAGADKLTETGIAVGTPAYMSPEQSLGDSGLDARSDVYSLGCVLFEMLAGRPPFTGPSAQAIVAGHRTTPVPTLASLGVSAPPAVEAALDAALGKERDQRPANATEFRRLLDGSTAPRVAYPGGSRVPVAVAAVVAGLLLAGGIMLSRRHTTGGGTGTPATGFRSLAVLPFTSPDRDSANAYFGAGMAEELTTAFARVPGLRVASNGSASRLQDAGATDAELARQLDVQTLIEGTVRRSGERIRVTARLVNPRDGTVLWADQYDRQMKEVFDVQDEMARAIVTALRPTFVDTAQVAAARAVRGTADLEAYDLYLKGRYYWERRGASGLTTAIGYFQQALARDSSFARAWAGLSMSQVVLPLFVNLSADSLLTLSRQNAERAIRLDSTLADAHLALAYALRGQWRWPESEREFKKALALAPEDARIHHWYAVLLYVIGRTDEAVDQLTAAIRLDPQSPSIANDLAYATYVAGRYDEALPLARHAWTMDTTRSDCSLQLGMIQLARGRPDSALTAFEGASRLGIGFEISPFLSVTYRRLGRTRQADSLYADVLKRYGADRSLAWTVAIAAGGAGDLDRGIAAVKETIDGRPLLLTELSLPCDAMFDPLKRDARFGKMVGGAGMKVCGPKGEGTRDRGPGTRG
jgi:serine/threonine-protein kinase